MQEPWEEEYTEKKSKGGFVKGLIMGILLTLILALGVTFVIGRSAIKYLASYTVSTGSSSAEGSSAKGGSIKDRISEITTKLSLLEQMVNKYYLEEDEVDIDEMIEGIYKGYIDGLDENYTIYYTAEEYKALNESTSGVYCGIGCLVTQNQETGVITIVKPFENGPGYEVGILKDDVLYKVEGEEVTGMDLSSVVAKLKGEEDTSVHVEIYRPSENEYIELTIVRRKIEVPVVESEMLEDNIGYIEVAEFDETTSEQFNKAVDELTAQGMTGLIIDLRDNPGGLLSSAKALLDRILPKDMLLVYTAEKNGDGKKLYSEDDDSIDVPIVVLMNGNSASASEVFSGCLQDYEKATLVGEKSFGKGIVQYVLPLGDGSALKITSAKYYSPEGRNIHGTGIEPDVEVKLDDEQEGDEQLMKAQEVIQEQLN